MTGWGSRSAAAASAAAAVLIALAAPAAAQSDGSVGGGSESSSGSESSAPPSLLPPGFPCLHTDVYPVASWGWLPLDAEAPRFVEGEEASGKGWLDTSVPDGGRVSFFHAGINTPLRDLAADPASLAFTHQGRYTSFQLRLRGADRPDDPSGFTTLVWWPTANGDAGVDGWSTDSLTGGQWWSTTAIGGLAGGQGSTATLAEISAANPRAFVTSYGVLNDSGTGGADDVTYGCARWDFEPLPAGSS
ncbi:hypothetical protein ACFYVR_04265 [Rhodococcus sp. NPDC003318]|uniref:hypothetical protein n=1 Tax=Rhodococcus sp. NPDC003318 TaxID=3364503 RepID=UPI0036B9F2F5